MQVNGATHSRDSERRAREGYRPVAVRAPRIDSNIVERAAEALFQFVFSDCDRLDGRHSWAECEEETKAGFRREAAVVLASVWSVIPGGEYEGNRSPNRRTL